MAIAEGIKNSIDSIQESGRPGRIEVILERRKDLGTDDKTDGPVTNVVIRDTGIGFTEKNFVSFCTPDSEYKAEKGGKGLGRLVCLLVFESVEVKSTFQNGGEDLEAREFLFQATSPEILHRKHIPNTTPSTEVRLKNLRDAYNSSAATEFSKLVDWLIENLIPILIEKPPYLESLIVRDGLNETNLTEQAKGKILWTDRFNLRGYDFSADCYQTRHHGKADQVRLVAGDRVVNSNTRDFEEYLPHLASVEPRGSHVVLVRSKFFDEHVNDARNGVTFAADDNQQQLLGPTFGEFKQALSEKLKNQFRENIVSAEDLLRSKVSGVVHDEAPSYVPLLMGYFESKDFSNLKISDTADQILSSLDGYRRRETKKLKDESKRLARLGAANADYAKGARELAIHIATQKQVALAEYVCLRKIILDRLEELLSIRDDGTTNREDAIHNLIFPQRTNTGDHPGVEHQLWIIDERLESQSYIASDDPMSPRGDRPDLLIAMDRPGLFASDERERAAGYEKMVLVEFKRALEDLSGLSTDGLPHRQMMRYAAKIIEGKAVHRRTGRVIKVTQDARFYLYAVCELSRDFAERLRRDESFLASPTGDGAFSVKNDGRYYIEYLSLAKLLEDARARNLAFFERLGIEP